MYGEFLLCYIVCDQSGICRALLARESEPIIRPGKPEDISQYDLDVIFTDQPRGYEVDGSISGGALSGQNG